MNLRYILILLFVLVSTHVYADDAEDCAKSSGDAQLNACTRVIESRRYQSANLAWAYNNRGLVKESKGNLNGAMIDYNHAIELNPKDALAYFNRGNAKIRKGELEEAMTDYNRAIELNPQYTQAYYNRGNAKRDKGDLDGAIADYNHAIELEPQSAKAYYNRGNVARMKGALDGAIADYNRAIELNPQDADAYYNRGLATKDKGDLDGAIADYNRAIELNPLFTEAYYNRGLSKKDKGDLDGAIADYKRAIELNPKYGRAYSSRGRIHYYRGEFALASSDLARSQVLNPDTHTALWLYLARSRSGNEGKKELITNTIPFDTSKWPAPVVALYLGKDTPSTVLNAAEHPDYQTRRNQRCEAHFYVGSWQLLQGDRASGLASLRAARDDCPKTYIEYTGAVYELTKLEAH